MNPDCGYSDCVSEDPRAWLDDAPVTERDGDSDGDGDGDGDGDNDVRIDATPKARFFEELSLGTPKP